MDVPVQLVVFSIPVLIYARIGRRRGRSWQQIREEIGWQGCSPQFLLQSLGIAIVVGVLGWLALHSIPSEVLRHGNINTSHYAGWPATFSTFVIILVREAIYTTLGEEIFFRGFIGGWLTRRLGFVVGNAMQTLVFLLPHLLLLTLSWKIWPLLLVQAIAGWAFGWLRVRSRSIFPGWLAHSAANAVGAFTTLA
jgi:membrane protease YdiL (CAAX protease family)